MGVHPAFWREWEFTQTMVLYGTGRGGAFVHVLACSTFFVFNSLWLCFFFLPSFFIVFPFSNSSCSSDSLFFFVFCSHSAFVILYRNLCLAFDPWFFFSFS